MPTLRSMVAAAVVVAALPVSAPAAGPAPRLTSGPAAPSRQAHASAPSRAVVLRVGGTAFLTGPGNAPDACAGGTAPCWDYLFDVRGGGERLRLGIDHVVVGDVFSVTVTPPGGSAVRFGPGESLYSAERLFDSPDAGRWRVRVTADSASDERFRLRAKLEAPARPGRHVLVRPNLQVLPPYEFTFLTPLTNGSTGGAPRGAPGAGGASSCHAEEVVEEKAVRCLRMAFGVRNTGQGPMQLYYSDGAAAQDRTLHQRLVYADGDHVDRKAGIARWHATHGHYHHHDAVSLQLFRVTDRTRGTLTAAGPARRKGFAHREELLREWTRFYPIWEEYGFGLGAGWGDYYEWDRPGNYLDLGTNTDGHYVVRMVADPGNGLVESNERDNTGYTYFRITGTSVEAIESGRGSSPWDRCKIVMPIGAEFAPSARQPARSRGCPPDTT